MAVKILENVADNIEEIEEEYLVLRDLSMHPNIPAFHGLFLRPGQTQEEDQLWFVMEVSLSLYGLSISIAIICIFYIMFQVIVFYNWRSSHILVGINFI